MKNENMNSPLQVLNLNTELAMNRVNMSLRKMVLLGILAGMFISLGASASSVIMHGIGDVGLARLAGAVVFPVGLMMIVFIGGELFTGDCLLILGVLEKRYSVKPVVRVLFIVFMANLFGGILIAALVLLSGQFNYSDGLLGAYTIRVALGKTTMSFGNAFCSGVLCNVFVCGAVLMAGAAKDVVGKIFAIFFPIFAFVVSGYEHCVANMYYIPAGILAMGNEKYVQIAKEQYGYTVEQLEELNVKTFLVDSGIPVTLGNMVGGMIVVGVVLFFVHKKRSK